MWRLPRGNGKSNTGVYKVASPPLPWRENRIKLLMKKIKVRRREGEGKRVEGKEMPTLASEKLHYSFYFANQSKDGFKGKLGFQ